ncbi:alpha/beta fold hydrolase [Halieaceae bacterium IMCC14734]|uniref:Alpha/beta fold hydrolase n=1 Tax=Candidatus Litorirhabdus singularis TaxID=2518993 RepID=A0ABT3TF12_9GAMM|nr:alpha/beta fold hydrolase [Candidatus Litorirhabdus singularis]MCX2980886.1 alpha/beta fold hydrolase [Candidatus Litorirhabdus singularis]
MQLNYLIRGAGDPIILIHGLFGSASNLGIVARALAPHYSTYSLDVRNHGKSPHCDTMSYREMAADIIDFLDSQGIGQCPLLGHSMGGKIAMQVALDYPDRVSRLIIADVAPVDYPPHHQDTLAGLAAVAAATVTSRHQADAILAESVTEPGVRAFLLKSLERGEDGTFHWLLNREALTSNYKQLGAANQGKSFTGPVLFIKGGDSNYITDEHQPAVAELFPNAQLKIIEGTGHWLHAEKPDLFNKVVLRFLLG